MYKIQRSSKSLLAGNNLITLGLLIFMLMSVASFFVVVQLKLTGIINKYQGKIYPGITINGLDVSGLNEETAIETLENDFSQYFKDNSINFTFGDKTLNLSYDELGTSFNYRDTVSEVFAFLDSLSYGDRLNQIVKVKSINFDMKPHFNVSIESQDLLNKISETFNIDPVNATAYIKDGQVVITEGVSGVEVDKNSFIEFVNGLDPSSLNESSSFNLQTRSVDPDITSVNLAKINGKLSSYSTSYKSSSNARATNVELAAKAINGILLMPGESFSFNKVVGPRTRERGYQDAAIIVGNVYESGLGGGICQTSSTLHAAVVRSGIIPTQRRNHSLPTSYMPLGHDAVVAWGSLDYVFKNTYNFPILIDVNTDNRVLTISIYGDVTQVENEYSISTETYESVPFTTKTVYDNTLAKGKQVVEKNGVNGTKLRVKRIVKNKQTGQVVESKVLWNDYYYAQDKIVKVGTK